MVVTEALHFPSQDANFGRAAFVLAAATVLTVCVPHSALARAELPTMEAILNRSESNILAVRWLSEQKLIAELNEPTKNSTFALQISLEGGHATALGNGSHASPARDGRRFTQYTGDKWVVRNVQDSGTTQLAIPVDAGIFRWRPPSWSQDGRLVALAGVHYEGREEPQPTIIEGVRVIDVGASVDKRPWMTTNLFAVGTDRHAKAYSVEVYGWVDSYDWGPDGKLYFAPYRLFEKSDGVPQTVVYSWKPSEKEIDEIFRVRGLMQSMHPVISPDGRWMAVAYDQDGGVADDFVSLFIVELSSGEVRRLTYDLRIATQAHVWASDSRSLYFTARHGGFDRLYKIDLDGKVTLISKGEERRFDLQISPNGDRLSYQTANGYGRRDIRILNLLSGKERIVFKADDPTDEFCLGKFQQIQWANGEGQNLFGFLIFPRDFDASRKYPILVFVHGGGPGSRLYLKGPITTSLAPGPLEWHVWAALGYVVFVPDYGSTGSYGPAPVSARYAEGDFQGVDADTRDIESGVKHLLATGYIDPERMAIIGHSAGGARVNLLLTRSRLFRAAILNEAIASDPLSKLIWITTGVNTGRPFEGMLLGHLGVRLAEAPAQYQNSYLFDGYKSRTPTLLLVGNEESSATWPLASEILFSILRQYGTPTRMLRFVDEGHNYSTIPAAILAFQEMMAWLEIYLQKPPIHGVDTIPRECASKAAR